MATFTTLVEDYGAGKVGKKSLGRRHVVGAKKTEKAKTPNAIAHRKLVDLLSVHGTGPDGKKYKSAPKSTSKSTRDRIMAAYIEAMESSKQLRYMSMEVLAQVIKFLSTASAEKTYSDMMERYVENILTNTERKEAKVIPSRERAIMKLRLKAEFVRYQAHVEETVLQSEADFPEENPGARDQPAKVSYEGDDSEEV